MYWMPLSHVEQAAQAAEAGDDAKVEPATQAAHTTSATFVVAPLCS